VSAKVTIRLTAEEAALVEAEHRRAMDAGMLVSRAQVIRAMIRAHRSLVVQTIREEWKLGIRREHE
jgi:hypothetical protein